MSTYTIGQLARRVGLSVETLRYYEQEGLIDEPDRSLSGYRQYPEAAVQRLLFVRRAKDFGFTLRDIKRLLDLHESLSASRGDVRRVADERIAAIETQISELRANEGVLTKLRALCAGDGPAHGCPILTMIAGHCGDEVQGPDPHRVPDPVPTAGT